MFSTSVKSRLSLKAKLLATFIALFSAVALPQAVHLIGKYTGVGTSLGEMLLPMHLPIILVGILAGPVVGLAAGISAPIVSFALTGMPLAAMLPFMVIELGAYGLTAGLIANTEKSYAVKVPCFVKVLLVQIAGRLIKAFSILIAGNVLHLTALSPNVVFTAIPVGLLGIVLQLILISLIDFRVNNNGRI